MGSSTTSPPAPARVLRALEQFAPLIEPGSRVVEPLGSGAQAEVYAIRSRGRRPTGASDPDLVFKLYRDEVPDPGFVALEEFESLSRLHRALDGRAFGGWVVRTPRPLRRGESPPSLLMTRVPGRSLNSHLGGTGGESSPVPASLAGAVAAALGCYWREAGRIYGDLDFNNILVDPAAGTLSFVDPGMPGAAFLCEGVARDWFPASRDLGYLVFDAAVSVRSDLGDWPARGRRSALVEAILLGHAAGAGPEADRLGLLDEVHDCARAHLERVRAGWSPSGAWRLLLKGLASRGLDRAIGRLKAATAESPPGVARGRPARGEVACPVD